MTLPPSESSTRLHMIDQRLERVGWSVRRGNLRKEVRLASTQRQFQEERAAYAAGHEFADYVLLGRDGKPLAVVEAKRTSRDAYDLNSQRYVTNAAGALLVSQILSSKAGIWSMRFTKRRNSPNSLTTTVAVMCSVQGWQHPWMNKVVIVI